MLKRLIVSLLTLQAYLLGSNCFSQELPSAEAVIEKIRTNRMSPGFSIRAEVNQSIQGQVEKHSKISIVGQVTPAFSQFWIRPVSGEISKARQYFLASKKNGVSVMLITDESQQTHLTQSVDLGTEIADLGLYPADLLGLWMTLPLQEWIRSEKETSQTCSNLLSSFKIESEKLMHFENCINLKEMLVLSSHVYDEHGNQIRVTSIDKTARDSKGRLKPTQTTTITNKKRTQISIYSVDEDYVVNPETFSPLKQFISGSN